MNERKALSLKASAAWSVMVGLVWPTLFLMAATGIYVRVFGVGGYGLIALAQSSIALAGVARFGTTEATTKLVAEHLAAGEPGRVGGVVGAAVALSLLVAIAGGVVLLLLAPALARNVLGLSGGEVAAATQVLAVSALIFPAVTLSSGASAVFAGFQRYDRATLTGAGITTVTHVFGAIAAVATERLVLVVLGMAVGAWGVAAYAMARAVAWSGGPAALLRGARAELAEVARFGSGSFLVNLATAVFTFGGRITAGLFGGAAGIGLFAVASTVSSKIYALTIALTQAALPRMSEEAVKDARAGGGVLLGRMTNVATVVAVVVGSAAIAISHPFLRVWLGSHIGGSAYPVLVGLILCYGGAAVAVPSLYYLTGTGRVHTASGYYMLAGASQLAVTFAVGDALGVTAVVLGMGVFALVLVAMVILTARNAVAKVRIWDGRIIGFAAALAVPTGIVAYALSDRPAHVQAAAALLTMLISGAAVVFPLGLHRSAGSFLHSRLPRPRGRRLE